MTRFVSQGTESYSTGDSAAAMWAKLGSDSAKKGEARSEKKQDDEMKFALANIQYGNSKMVPKGTPGATQVPGTDIWVIDKGNTKANEAYSKLRQKTIDDALNTADKMIQTQMLNPDFDGFGIDPYTEKPISSQQATLALAGQITGTSIDPEELQAIWPEWQKKRSMVEGAEKRVGFNKSWDEATQSVIYTPTVPEGSGNVSTGSAGASFAKTLKAVPKVMGGLATSAADATRDFSQDFFGEFAGEGAAERWKAQAEIGDAERKASRKQYNEAGGFFGSEGLGQVPQWFSDVGTSFFDGGQ